MRILTRIPFDERLEPSVIGRLVSVFTFNMADLINFISKREIDAKKEETRKAREQILKKVGLLGGRSIKMLEKLSQSRRNAFHRKASCISCRVLLKVLLFGALEAWLNVDLPFVQAKGDYEREQWKKQKRIESGETSWMLPSLSNSLTVEDDSHNDKVLYVVVVSLTVLFSFRTLIRVLYSYK